MAKNETGDSDNIAQSPLAKLWVNMNIEQKQLIQDWCLKTKGVMYAVWKNDAEDEEFEKFFDKLDHAVDNNDWTYFKFPEAEEPEAVAEEAKPDDSMKTAYAGAAKAISFNDDELKAMLEAAGYEPILKKKTRTILVTVEMRMEIDASLSEEDVETLIEAQSKEPLDGGASLTWKYET